MRVVRVRPDGRERSSWEIFVGTVDTQRVVGDESRDLRLTEVTFRDGGRNKLHRHHSDQILLITDGRGVVATETERHEVGAGDVAVIPAGEPHWHGAQPGADMTHWSVLGPGDTEIVGD